MKSLFIIFTLFIFSFTVFGQNKVQPGTPVVAPSESLAAPTTVKPLPLQEVTVIDVADEETPEKEQPGTDLLGRKPKSSLANYLLTDYKVLNKIYVGSTTRVHKINKVRKVYYRRHWIKKRTTRKVRRTVKIYADSLTANTIASIKNEFSKTLRLTSAYRSRADQLALRAHNKNAAPTSGPLRSLHDRTAFDIGYAGMNEDQQAKFGAYLLLRMKSRYDVLPTKETYKKCFHIVAIPPDKREQLKEWINAVESGNLQHPLVQQTLNDWRLIGKK